MTKRNYKSIIKFLLDDEQMQAETVSFDENKYQSQCTIINIGKVNDIVLNLILEPVDHVDYGKHNIDSAVRYKYDDSFAINISINTLYMFLDNVDTFMAIIAHEIGHIDCGHLDKDKQFSITSKEVQPIFIRQTNPIKAITDVVRCNLLQKEYEADIAAMKYVTVSAIINLHLQTLHGASVMTSIASKIEKMNRCIFYARKMVNKIESPDKNLTFKFNLEVLIKLPGFESIPTWYISNP